MQRLNNSISVETEPWLHNTSPNLTHDEADALYFECRDMDKSHEEAIANVRKNGVPQNWIEPRATDYQGLPDREPTQRELSPLYANFSNAAASHPAIFSARQHFQQTRKMSVTDNAEAVVLPAPGTKIQNHIFYREKIVGGLTKGVITAEKKYGAVGLKGGGGNTKARLSCAFQVDIHGYTGALEKAKEKLAVFVAENESKA